MKKKVGGLIAVACFVLVCFVIVVSKKNKEEIFDIAQLRTENGTYQYKDIPFGSSYEETVKKIPLKFEKMTSDSYPEWAHYYADERVEFYGEEVKFSLDFSDDKLQVVQISAELSGGDEQFEELAAKMVELYGEAETVITENSVIYKWENGGSHMNAILTEDNGKKYGIFGVFYQEKWRRNGKKH